MKSLYIILVALLIFSNVLYAQNKTGTTQSNPKYSKQQAKPIKQKSESSFKMDRFFYGGSLGFSFGNLTSFRVNPLIGYNLTSKLSAGISGLFEYNSYKIYDVRQHYSNYGGSVFTRFKIIPQLYAHAEFSYISYEFSDSITGNYRQGIPFLFLGGGYVQHLVGNTYAYAQILFDVLQDTNSPYDEWAPFYSVGISVGF